MDLHLLDITDIPQPCFRETCKDQVASGTSKQLEPSSAMKMPEVTETIFELNLELKCGVTPPKASTLRFNGVKVWEPPKLSSVVYHTADFEDFEDLGRPNHPPLTGTVR